MANPADRFRSWILLDGNRHAVAGLLLDSVFLLLFLSSLTGVMALLVALLTRSTWLRCLSGNRSVFPSLRLASASFGRRWVTVFFSRSTA